MDLTALFKLSYGVYIVTSGDKNLKNGCIANTFAQVTSDPPAFMVCMNKDNYTHEVIGKTGLFAASILIEEAPFPYIGKFGFRCGRDFDKFDGISTIESNGVPIPDEYTAAYLVCKTKQSIDLGTHTMFIGDLIDAANLKEGNPMTYAYYHDVKKGKTAKNAPTYVNLNQK